MTSFDPTDPKYQLTPEFLPDKESTWSYPKEDDGWVISHNALEGEIGMFLEALANIDSKGDGYPLLEWEVKSLKTAFAAHFENVHWHHSDEDDNVVPFMKTRVKYPEKLETDHPTIEAQIDKIKGMIEGIKTGDTIGDLFVEWKKHQDLIVPHMHEENEVALPLMRAYFTAEDLKPVVEYIVKNGPKVSVLSLVYWWCSYWWCSYIFIFAPRDIVVTTLFAQSQLYSFNFLIPLLLFMYHSNKIEMGSMAYSMVRSIWYGVS
jgi:hemerythrin-like domain-containing protein